MTKSGFGEHLKREREMRQVSLDEICVATRIGNRFLEALEQEDWDRLPGGVFNRGFVRAVSRYLGLDEEAMVAEYVLATAERTPTPEWAKPQPAAAMAPENHRLRWIGIGLVLLLIAAGALGWRVYAAHRAVRRAAAISEELAAQPVNDELSPRQPASADTLDQSASVPQTDPATEPEPAGGKALQLKIEAGEGTSVTVSADGSKVFDGSMIAGQSRQFGAQIDFEVQAKDAGAVLLELNGQTLAPIGPPGRAGMVVLTRDDLKTGGGAH